MSLMSLMWPYHFRVPSSSRSGPAPLFSTHPSVTAVGLFLVPRSRPQSSPPVTRSRYSSQAALMYCFISYRTPARSAGAARNTFWHPNWYRSESCERREEERLRIESDTLWSYVCRPACPEHCSMWRCFGKCLSSASAGSERNASPCSRHSTLHDATETPQRSTVNGYFLSFFCLFVRL